jgi:predicted membrane-bound dolichyl-phosphate-mannose-protein mannosyltransferase
MIMYAIIWILGNHTFYSFYAVQLTPAAGAVYGELLVLLAPRGESG